VAVRPNSSLLTLGSWLELPAYVLFFLMLAFPMVMDLLYVKAALFAFVLFTIGAQAVRGGRLRLHPSIGLWTLVVCMASLVFVGEGVINGAPGALKQAQVYVLWPIVYAFLIAGTTTLPILVALERVMVLATLFACAYGLDYILTNLQILPASMYISLFDQGEAIGLHEGYLAFNLYFLNSLPFLVPFVMAVSLARGRATTTAEVARPWSWIALGLGLGVVLVSGRRVLMLVTAIAPFFIVGFTLIKGRGSNPPELRRLLRPLIIVLVILVGLVGLLNRIYDVDLGSYTSYFGEAIDPRREQFDALLQGWSENPVLGAGHGASAAGVIRSESMPWAYELYYVALLFQTGVLGFGIYLAAVLWTYVMGLRVIRDGGALADLMIPTLVGTSCFLIANATDPYLARFDGLWTIFLPLAVINFWLLSRNQGQRTFAT